MATPITATAPRASSSTATVLDQGIMRGAIGLTVVTLAGFGFLYSLVGVGIGQALFPDTANGSVIERNGKIIGSALVAQPFVGEGYFHPRPSATGYNTMALAGSNQARTNPDLRQRLEATRAAVAQREGVDPAMVPHDLITQSGGGIDPHVSPEGAAIQIERVARARGLERGIVEQLVTEHTEGKQLGVLGQARVHVLKLNLALDALGTPSVAASSARPSSGVEE